MMQRSFLLVGTLAVLSLCSATPAMAENTTAESSYSGRCIERSAFTGDWGGARNDWAANGVTFDASLTQIGQGVVDGGKNGSWEYGGRGNLTSRVDTGKLGLWPGGFLTAELEGNFGDSLIGKTGSLMPANANQLFPLPTGDNVALPQLSFAQFVSPYAGGLVGKLDTMSGDANAFAHGKGDRQFFNTAFSINPVTLVVPYSPLGAGVIVLPTKDHHEAILNFLVVSANGKASTDGFDDIAGAIFTSEGRVRTGFFGRTGHQLVGALYSNKQYTSLDQRLGSVIDNRELGKQSDTWAVYYNFDQFLYEADTSAGKGVGVFGRFGASEGNPNPAQYFYSVGFGGKGIVPSRDLDRFGIGYYYIDVANPTFQRRLETQSFLRDEWGFEVFYNVALTPWLLLTPDIQVIGPSQKRHVVHGDTVGGDTIGTATVLGVRLQLLL